jgi:hypothetical protein
VKRSALKRGTKDLERRTPLNAKPASAPRWLAEAVSLVEGGATYEEVARAVGSSKSSVSRAVLTAAPHLARERHPATVERSCAQCKSAFVVAGYIAARPGQGRFCGRACSNLAQREAKLARLAASPCAFCGGVKPEAKMHQKACSTPCASALKAEAKLGSANPNWMEQTSKDWWDTGRENACRQCGSARGGRRLHLHHVVYEQHVRANHGDAYDPSNSLTLCVRCHAAHHKSSVNPAHIPITLLRDENFTFAARLLGRLAAYNYLSRRYPGEDPRLSALLSKTTGTRR